MRQALHIYCLYNDKTIHTLAGVMNRPIIHQASSAGCMYLKLRSNSHSLTFTATPPPIKSLIKVSAPKCHLTAAPGQRSPLRRNRTTVDLN